VIFSRIAGQNDENNATAATTILAMMTGSAWIRNP
jgi:hypothetical protein